MTDVQELGGHGVTAKVDGKTVAAGNARLMAKLGLTVPEITEPGTIVHVAVEGRYAAICSSPMWSNPTVLLPSRA